MTVSNPVDWEGVTVSIRQNWADDWEVATDLKPKKLSRTLGTSIDQATFFSYSSESILEPGDTVFSRKTAVDYVGYYVRLRKTDMNLDWVGRIVDDRADRWGVKDDALGDPRLQGGDVIYVAHGLEYLLDRVQIHSLFYHPAVEVPRPVPFNGGFGENRGQTYFDRGNKRVGSRVFAVDKTNRSLWDMYDMIEYLLTHHTPKDSNGTAVPGYSIDLALFQSYLNWAAPTIRTENSSTLAVINSIISPRSGLIWWLQYMEFTNEMAMNVSSTTDVGVALPGGTTIPAASTVHATLNLDELLTIRSSQVTKHRRRQYDRVRVRGARRTGTFTVGFGDTTLEKGWTQAIENEYKAAGGAVDKTKADRFRQAERYERVYRAYVIPNGWNGKSGDGTGGAPFLFSCPILALDTPSIIGAEIIVMQGLRVLRNTLLKVGYDYTDAENPLGFDPNGTEPEYAMPLAIGLNEAKWIPLHAAARDQDEDEPTAKALKTSYSTTAMSNSPGVMIRSAGGMAHAIAENHFDPATDAPSRTTPELDWEDMRVTITGEWDAHCEGEWPPVFGAVGVPTEELLLNIGERARYDYLAENTVWDVQDGVAKVCTNGGTLRDDRILCRALSRAAFVWYSLARGTFSFTYSILTTPNNNNGVEIKLGDYIGDVGSTIPVSVNSSVSEITYDFENGLIELRGGFVDIDFARLV